MWGTHVWLAVVVAGAILAATTTSAAPAELAVDEVGEPGVVSSAAVRLNPPLRSFTVAAVGDFLSESSLNGAAATYAPPGVRFDYAPLFAPIAAIVQSADLSICHMETPVGAPGAVVGLVGKSAWGPNRLALSSRLVYPGISTLADPTISATLRTQLQACVTRSAAVVADLR